MFARPVKGFFLAAVFSFAISSALAAPQQSSGASANKDLTKSIQAHSKQLEETRRQIKDLESKKTTLKKTEDGIRKALRKIHDKIEQSIKRQAQLKAKIKITEGEIEKCVREIRNYSEQKLRWEGAFLQDFRKYYQERVYPGRATPSLETYGMHFALREKFSDMKQAEKNEQFFQAQETRLEHYRKTLDALTNAAKKELELQQQAQEEKNDLLKTTVGQRLSAEEESKRLKETSKMLENLIVQLQRKRKTVPAQDRDREQKIVLEKKGNFSWPVEGKIVSQFGKQIHPELKIPVFNKGVRIEPGGGGQSVKAISDGTVVFCDYFRSYGQTIIIDHGGEFYSVYGLLGGFKVDKDQRVKEGQPIAALSGKDPEQVYFELRYQGDAENPLAWLK